MGFAKYTLFGANRWMLSHEDDLFKNLVVPAPLNKDTAVDVILQKGADFEVLYGDPYFIQDLIGVWSNKWQATFERWAKALEIEYNPLENYDRYEDWVDSGSKFNKENGSNVRTSSSEDKNNSTLASQIHNDVYNNDEIENKKSAFDDGNYAPLTKTDDTINGTNDTRSMTAGSTDDNKISTDVNNDYKQNEEQNSDIHKGHIHGNIGVTTSQQMLSSELAIATFNVYDEIAELFLKEFVVSVY